MNNSPSCTTKSNIGSRINSICAKKSKKEVAKVMGLSESQLYRVIAGDSQPKAESVGRLAKEAGVSLDWLILGVEPKCGKESKTLGAERFENNPSLSTIAEPPPPVYADSAQPAFDEQIFSQVLSVLASEQSELRALPRTDFARHAVLIYNQAKLVSDAEERTQVIHSTVNMLNAIALQNELKNLEHPMHPSTPEQKHAFKQELTEKVAKNKAGE